MADESAVIVSSAMLWMENFDLKNQNVDTFWPWNLTWQFSFTYKLKMLTWKAKKPNFYKFLPENKHFDKLF